MWSFVKRFFNRGCPVDEPGWKKIKVKPCGMRVQWREKNSCTLEEFCYGVWYNKDARTFMLDRKGLRLLYIKEENLVKSIEILK